MTSRRPLAPLRVLCDLCGLNIVFKGVETMLLEDLRVQIADMEKKLDEMRASL